MLLVLSGPIRGLNFYVQTIVGGKLQIVKKGSIRTALQNGTFFPTIRLVVVNGGAKIRSPKTFVQCLNSVSININERRVFLEMV